MQYLLSGLAAHDEIYWLTLSTAWTTILFVPYAVVRIAKIGWAQVIIDPLPGDDPFEKAWAHRAYRAHMNSFEALITFAPLALAITLTGAGTEATRFACALFFFARMAHAPIYILKVPALRLGAYLVGLGATLYLAFVLITS